MRSKPPLRVSAAQPSYSRTTRFSHGGMTLVVKQLDTTGERLYVLVHGIGVASRYFGPLAARLGASGSVVAVELPGMGDAPEPANGVAIERYGALLAAWALTEGIRDAVVVGHSMGAQVVTEFALQAPDAVGRLVLIGAVTDPRERSVLRQSLRLAQDSLRERIDVNWIIATDYLKCGPRFMLKQAPVMVDYPMLERAARLGAPTLVLRGEHDPISRPQWNRALGAAIPDARVRTILDNAHVGMYLDPEATAGLIAEFLAETRTLPRADSRVPSPAVDHDDRP